MKLGHIWKEGIQPAEATMVQKCIKGVFTLPPDQDMGCAWIKGWYWDAGDVTHVLPRISKFSDISRYATYSDWETNDKCIEESSYYP